MAIEADDLKTLVPEENIAESKNGESSAAAEGMLNGLSIDEMLAELKDRQSRPNNAIFYKIPESSSASLQARITEDFGLIEDFLKRFSFDARMMNELKVRRIGKLEEKPIN